MVISLKGMNSVDKSKLMMLEMIANANWERPIYVAMTVGQENYMNLGDNFVQEGLVNRITPFTTNTNGKPVAGMKDFDTQKTYDCVMNHFKFGGASTPGIYLDETVMRMCYTHRRLMVQLATNLIAEGDTVKAAEVLERAELELPAENVPHDFQCSSIDMAQNYAAVGNTDKALELIDTLWTKSAQYCNYYLQFDGGNFRNAEQKVRLHFYLMQSMLSVLEGIDGEKAEQYMSELYGFMDTFQKKGGKLG